MNHDQFPGSCGRCVRVSGTDSGASGKSFLVMIVDGELTVPAGPWAGLNMCTVRSVPVAAHHLLPSPMPSTASLPAHDSLPLPPLLPCLQSAPSASMATLTSPPLHSKPSPVSPASPSPPACFMAAGRRSKACALALARPTCQQACVPACAPHLALRHLASPSCRLLLGPQGDQVGVG